MNTIVPARANRLFRVRGIVPADAIARRTVGTHPGYIPVYGGARLLQRVEEEVRSLEQQDSAAYEMFDKTLRQFSPLTPARYHYVFSVGRQHDPPCVYPVSPSLNTGFIKRG